MRRAAASIGVAALLLTWSASAASAAPAETIIEGEVLRLVSVQDAQAMAAMLPGAPVAWDVEVSSSEPDGSIDVGLDVLSTAPDAYAATVRACGERWTDAGCASGATSLLDAPLVEGSTALLAQQDAVAVAWYRIEVELLEPRGGASVDLRFTVDGFGDTLVDDGGGEVGVTPPGAGLPGLPPTGSSILWAGMLAVVAIGVGVVASRLPERSRRRER